MIKAVLDNGLGPGSNVYAELGTTWFNLMSSMSEAAHVLGKLLKYLGPDRILWGTDSYNNGGPQPQIQAFRAFQIPESMQMLYGYPALTAEVKRKIFGLNAAAVYGVDPADDASQDHAGRHRDRSRSRAAPSPTPSRAARARTARARAANTWRSCAGAAKARAPIGSPAAKNFGAVRDDGGGA